MGGFVKLRQTPLKSWVIRHTPILTGFSGECSLQSRSSSVRTVGRKGQVTGSDLTFVGARSDGGSDKIGRCSSMVERRPCKSRVAGSIPATGSRPA